MASCLRFPLVVVICAAVLCPPPIAAGIAVRWEVPKDCHVRDDGTDLHSCPRCDGQASSIHSAPKSCPLVPCGRCACCAPTVLFLTLDRPVLRDAELVQAIAPPSVSFVSRFDELNPPVPRAA